MPIGQAKLDFSMAWSHNLKWVVNRRVVGSSDGPPGVYLVSPLGGTPRWLMPASFFWPANMRFSPDAAPLPRQSALRPRGRSIAALNKSSRVAIHCDPAPGGASLMIQRIDRFAKGPGPS